MPAYAWLFVDIYFLFLRCGLSLLPKFLIAFLSHPGLHSWLSCRLLRISSKPLVSPGQSQQLINLHLVSEQYSFIDAFNLFILLDQLLRYLL